MKLVFQFSVHTEIAECLFFV